MKTLGGYSVYKFEEFDTFMKSVESHDFETFTENNTRCVKVGSGFDIETTRAEKYSYMYAWQFSLGKDIIIGRKWEQFNVLLNTLGKHIKDKYKTSWGKDLPKLIVWVANLGHEFMFIKHRMSIEDTFAAKEKHPMKFRSGVFEFRDCLLLSGQGGLENLAKNYTKTKKMAGDLDYTKPRNSKTPLTDKEERYLVNDVAILSEWSDYCFERFGTKIPLTSTGIVRNMVKDEIYNLLGEDFNDPMKEINRVISKAMPKTVTEYNFDMRFLFRGGFTHANVWYAGFEEPESDVWGVDFTSSYPAQMLHWKYPTGMWRKSSPKAITLDKEKKHIIRKDFRDIRNGQAFRIVATFKGLRSKTLHSVESSEKAIHLEGAAIDNGRISSAKSLQVAITEVDYAVYEMFYEWDEIIIESANVCTKEPLPDYLLNPLKVAYVTKCHLKQQGLDGTIEYINAKAAVNSFYGMCVTRLYLATLRYDEARDWHEEDAESYEVQRKKQFLSPYYGIWITAYARHELLSVVKALDPDVEHYNVIYCDTDSIYMKDSQRNREIIDKYNTWIMKMNESLPPEFADIGAFDEIMSKGDKTHGGYYFKTLGAKRYIKYKNGHAEVTVAGMRKGTLERSVMMKKEDVPEGFELPEDWFEVTEKVKDDDGNVIGTNVLGYCDSKKLFDSFDDRLFLDADASFKSTARYNETPHSDVIIDEFGNVEEMHEFSSLAICPINFKIKISEVYVNYFIKVHEERRRVMQ